MRELNRIIFLLNKISFIKFINSDYDEKFKYILRVLKDNSGDDSVCRVENKKIDLEEILRFFDRFRDRLGQFWKKQIKKILFI